MDTGSKGHILIVDFASTGCEIVDCLRADEFSLIVAKDRLAMDLAMASKFPDVILLHLDKPCDASSTLCMTLRDRCSVPIVLTAKQGSDIDRIYGLEIGADDYLTGPFNPRELLARIHAILRRARMNLSVQQAQILVFAGWTLSHKARCLTAPDGEKVNLTSMEFDLLALFCDHPGRLFSRKRLLDLAPSRSALSNTRSIDVAVSRLRAKIEINRHAPHLIKTIRSGGYMFMAEVTTGS